MPVTTPKAVTPAKKTILLVDDNPAIRQILLRLLVGEGYFVQMAANGVEALALADATPFNLVLLDLNMPVKNGRETFRQLSRKNPLLPIILITARPDQFSDALAAGSFKSLWIVSSSVAKFSGFSRQAPLPAASASEN